MQYNKNETLGYAHTKLSNNKNTTNTLFICMILVGSFMVIEFIGGYITHSIALISDSIHMLSDFLAFALSLIGMYISRKRNDSKRTYGYTRFETLTSFVNALSLIAICFVIAYFSIMRFLNPPEVDGLKIVPVAMLGVIVNIIIMILLMKNDISHSHGEHNHSHHKHTHSHSHEQTNKHAHTPKRSLLMQGLVLHILSDLFGFVSAMVAGIVIHFTSFNIIDPILSLVMVFLILRSTWKVTKDSANILLESTPNNINPITIKNQLEKNIESVSNVHHIHLWMLNEEENIITMHCVLYKNTNVNESINKIKNLLKEQFNIEHSTTQIEIEGRKNIEDCSHDQLLAKH